MVRISPSILSADQSDLNSAMAAAADGGADYIHVDVMDLHFVPNLTIGPSVVADLCGNSSLPLDVHLMVDDPTAFTELLASQLRKRVIGEKVSFDKLGVYPDDAIKTITGERRLWLRNNLSTMNSQVVEHQKDLVICVLDQLLHKLDEAL